MSVITPAGPDLVVYPESDGKPMAQNTKQLEWIVVLYDNLSALFADRPDVFVAADLFWYPIEGRSEVKNAPDVLAVFGRPKGHRGSYRQWEEENVPVTVAFEVLSPGNLYDEMIDKHVFYEEHGVEEYYVYNPDTNRFFPHLRQGEMLRPVTFVREHVSPRLGVRFVKDTPEMKVFYPDGRPFLTFEQLAAARAQTERERDEAHKQRDEARKQQGELSRQRDEALRKTARLAELTGKVLDQTATPEERAEFDRLRREAGPSSPAS